MYIIEGEKTLNILKGGIANAVFTLTDKNGKSEKITIYSDTKTVS